MFLVLDWRQHFAKNFLGLLLFVWSRYWTRSKSKLVSAPPLVKVWKVNPCVYSASQKFVRRQTTCRSRLLSRFFFHFFKTKLSICFSSRKASQRDSSMAAFLPGFASLKQALMADFSKIFYPFKFLTIGRVFFHCCHKMKYSCYQDSSFIPSWIVYLFFCWGKWPHVIQRKWMLNMQTFAAEYRNGFWPHVLAIRSCF